MQKKHRQIVQQGVHRSLEAAYEAYLDDLGDEEIAKRRPGEVLIEFRHLVFDFVCEQEA